MKIIIITARSNKESIFQDEDVYAFSLFDNLGKLGTDVTIISPSVSKKGENIQKLFEFPLRIFNTEETITVWKFISGIRTRLIIEKNKPFKQEEVNIPGSENLIYNAAVCEAISRLIPDSDVIITDGISAAASQIFMRYGEHRFVFRRSRSIHMVYTLRERASIDDKDMCLFPNKEDLLPIFRLGGKNDLTRAAIISADRVIVPSVSYCDDLHSEAREPRYCHTVRQFGFKFKGICKGVDYDKYDPSNGKFLKHSYDLNNISGKAKNKLYVQNILGLKQDKNIPLVTMFCRDKCDMEYSLLTAAASSIRASGTQLVICMDNYSGGTDRRRHVYENSRIVEFDEPSQKLLFLAASDIFICIPPTSPSGIESAYACRYGSVPVVFSTGGLKDRVKYYERTSCKGNGFTFNTYNAHDMLYTLWDALGMYRNEKGHWMQVVKNAMSCDFSLEQTAREILKYIS